VALTKDAPKDECTVNLTPRRLQKFLVKSGDTVKWSCGTQSGEVKADANGLVTIEKLVVTKGKVRVKMAR
jgi:hypothetical protein